MPTKVTDSEIREMLQEMETDLEKAYDLEKDRLVKAFPPGQEDDSASAPAEASDSADGSMSAPPAPDEASDASASAIPAPDASAAAPAEMSGAPAGEAPMDPAAAGADGAPLTPEALQAEYAQLSPEELDMHIKAALTAKEALAATAAPGMDAGMSPDGASAPAGSPPPAMKAEPAMTKVDKKAIGGQMVPVKKNETDPEIESLKALVKSQAEDIEILTKSVKLVMEQPVRKAITSVAFVPKVEAEAKPISRATVQQLIKDNAHKLTKAERDLTLDVLDGRVPASRLEAVLEKLTAK